jgi:hypothetical protein
MGKSVTSKIGAARGGFIWGTGHFFDENLGFSAILTVDFEEFVEMSTKM